MRLYRCEAVRMAIDMAMHSPERGVLPSICYPKKQLVHFEPPIKTLLTRQPVLVMLLF